MTTELQKELDNTALSLINEDVKIAIAKTQFKQDVEKIDLKKVTEFGHWNFPNYNGELNELKYFPNLRLISIRGDVSYNYENLLLCPKLTTLYIGFLHNSDLLNIISEIKTLKRLSISNCSLQSSKILTKLKKLTEISLENTEFIDVDFLRTLKSLKSITLTKNQKLFSLPDISNQNLERIDVSSSNFKIFPQIKSSKIVEIRLDSTEIIDFSFLESFNNNTTIVADYAQFKEIKQLYPYKFNFSAVGFSDTEIDEFRAYMDIFLKK